MVDGTSVAPAEPKTDIADQARYAQQNDIQYPAMSARQARMRRQAMVDAYHLRELLTSGVVSRPEIYLGDPRETPAYRPDTYAQQLHYLEAVACALRQRVRNPRVMRDRLVAKGQLLMWMNPLQSTGQEEHGGLSSANDETAPATRNHSSPDPAQQLARIVSEVANPLFVALPTFLIVALHTAPNWQRGMLWWLVTTIGISAVPFLFVHQSVRQGRYSDHYLSVRSQRLMPLVVGLFCAAIALVLLLVLQASPTLLATVAAVLVCGICTLAITTRWKISFHLVGAAGAGTVLTLLFGPIGLVLVPFVVTVGWARWQLQAHTVAQALADTALAVVITVGMFHVFGLI